MFNLSPSLFYLFVLSLIWSATLPKTRSEERASVSASRALPISVRIPGLQNMFRVTDRIYSGSQPEGNLAFEALAKLGVKTIISVDGSKPDLASAHRYGLRYVHLPFGYDGIPVDRVAELAQATLVEPGLFYVHCHHGMHRGPTAVAVICEATAEWNPDQAVAWLRQAGTSEDFPGLYRAAREFKRPGLAQVSGLGPFPEAAPASSFVEAMVSIEEHFSRLQKSQKAGWKTPPDHSGDSPLQEAAALEELFREIPRSSDVSSRPKYFREKLAGAERAAGNLRACLASSTNQSEVDTALKRTAQSCADCHQIYRNKSHVAPSTLP